jgi:hypothetical protein
VARVLAAAIVCFILVHAAVQVAKFRFGHDHLLGFNPLFDLNVESNVPTWYSSSVFLITAAALAVISLAHARRGDRFTRHWLGLALIFLYLSLDESSRMHENWGVLLDRPLARWRTPEVFGGLFRNLWVIPAGILAILVGALYVPFLRHLPGRTRGLFVISGVLFVAAAVGMEMVGARYSALGGRYRPGFMVLVTIEEALEMISILIFLYAVLTYAATAVGTVRLRISAR